MSGSEWGDEGGMLSGGEAPTSRTYVHIRCRGATTVGGGDYTHICDPFWPCTETYCCTCQGFAPVGDVVWMDTGERVSEYRSRLRANTPLALKFWRYGAGFLIGGGLGAFAGQAVAASFQAPPKETIGCVAVGGLLGAILVYLIGTMVLNQVYKIDYRRIR